MEKANENLNEGKKLLRPAMDIVFQILFSKENEDITKSFIEDIIEEKIDSIVINDEKELCRESAEDKLGILDLEAYVNGNEKIDIEVQLIDRKNLAERLLFYFSKLYTKEIKIGYEYEHAKRVVIVAIIDYKFDKTKHVKEMETVWRLIEEKHKIVLTDKIEIRIIELHKAREEYKNNGEDKKAQWMMFLNNPNDLEVKEIMEKNKNVKKAIVEVRRLSEDEKTQRLADLRLKAIMDEKDIYAAGVDKGKKIGLKAGAKQERNHILKQMLKNNITIEEIVQMTGISRDEILKIKNS